jgi:hypothetical protein
VSDQLKDFRAHLQEAHARADNACAATWRASRDARHLADAFQKLAPRMANAAIRDALALTTTKIAADAMQAENAAWQRRSELRELMDLVGREAAADGR